MRRTGRPREVAPACVSPVLGVGATFAATALTWFPPTVTVDAGNSICVVVDGKVIVKVAGASLPVIRVVAGQTAPQLRVC